MFLHVMMTHQSVLGGRIFSVEERLAQTNRSVSSVRALEGLDTRMSSG